MGINNSKIGATAKFLNAKFPSQPHKFYDVGSTCRRSGWTVSKQCRDKASGDLAMAEYWHKAMSRKEVERLARVYQTFTRTSHPHVLKLRHVFRLTKEKYVFVTDNYQNMDLFDIIISKKMMREGAAARYTQQILSALLHLHQLGLMHRDIKPEWAYFKNPECTHILLHPGPHSGTCGQEKRATAAGGGTSERRSGRVHKTSSGTRSSKHVKLCGTPSYMAPEIANREEYGKEVDCWSLGVTVFVMLSGTLPFTGEDDKETLALVQKGEYEFHDQVWDTRSEEAKDFVKRLLTLDPKQRMTCEEAMEHAWITNFVQ